MRCLYENIQSYKNKLIEMKISRRQLSSWILRANSIESNVYKMHSLSDLNYYRLLLISLSVSV